VTVKRARSRTLDVIADDAIADVFSRAVDAAFGELFEGMSDEEAQAALESLPREQVDRVLAAVDRAVLRRAVDAAVEDYHQLTRH
jgi:hypothetical protein